MFRFTKVNVPWEKPIEFCGYDHEINFTLTIYADKYIISKSFNYFLIHHSSKMFSE